MAHYHVTVVFDGVLVGRDAEDASLFFAGAGTEKVEGMNENLNTRTPWTREAYLREFQSLTTRMLEITTKKNNDYGGATDPFKNFRDFQELGILVRMSDKFARLRTAIVEKRAFEVVDESVEDTCIDLANYALLLLCYRRGA